MTAAVGHFEDNLGRARDLVGLSIAVGASTTEALDTDDLLRSALVAGVSALDHYVHEVVRELMVETALGSRPPTDAFRRFPVSLESALAAAGGRPAPDWMDEEIRRQHGHLSFQHPDKIADAVRLVWDQPLWQTVAAQLGLDSKVLKQQLLLAVQRRNQIAHEADRDPTPPHPRWPIHASDVGDALDLVESIVRALDAVI